MSIINRVFDGQRVLDGDAMSKRQMADIINRQSAQLQALQRDRFILRSLLLAIVQAPEAFIVGAEQQVSIDRAAVERVKDSTELNVHPNPISNRLELSTSEPAPKPLIELPTIQLH